MEQKKSTHTSPKAEELYSSFLFIRLDPKFRLLMSNERITAKQEFENFAASCQEKLFLRTYSLIGMRSDCDILFWRISPDANVLQETCAHMFSSGIGKFFIPVHSFLGFFRLPESAEDDSDLKEMFGKFKFLLLHPVVRTHSWHNLSGLQQQKLLDEHNSVLSGYAGVHEHIFQSCGLDDQDMTVIKESDNLDELAAVSKKLRNLKIMAFILRDTPRCLCLGKDLRDILDALG